MQILATLSSSKDNKRKKKTSYVSKTEQLENKFFSKN